MFLMSSTQEGNPVLIIEVEIESSKYADSLCEGCELLLVTIWVSNQSLSMTQ